MMVTAQWAGPAAAILGAMAFFAAPAANAIPDVAFEQVLAQHGITWPADHPEIVINAAHGVCQDWAGGFTFAQTFTDLKKATSLSDENGGYFIGAATQGYCPQYVSNIPS